MFVPKKVGERKELLTPPNSPNEKSSIESLEASPKPGHAKRIHSAEGSEDNFSHSPQHQHLRQSSSAPISSYPTYKPSSKSSRAIDPADRECLERFLNINARHITDGQGVVSGVLLITPNAIMFDPNVSDPLVIEHGAEAYGVTVPMEMVLKTALYSDIAHMRVKHAPEAVPAAPRPEVYYANEDQLDDDSLLKARCGQIVGTDLGESQNSESTKAETDVTDVRTDCNVNVEPMKSEEKSDPNDSTNFESNEMQSISCEEINDSNLDNTKNEDKEKASDKTSESDQQKASKEEEKSDENVLETKDTDEKKEEEISEAKDEVKDETKEETKEEAKKEAKEEEKVSQSNTNEAQNERSSKPENPVYNKVTLGIRHSVPDTILHDRKQTTTLVTAISAEESSSVDKRRSAQGESRREQMLKRLSNPVDTIGNLTKSGISSGINATKTGINATKTGISSGINATKTGINKVLATPKNIVEFSSGLVRDAKDALTTTSSSGSKSDSLEADLEIFTKGTTDSKKSHSTKGSDNRQSSIGYQNMVDSQIDVFANFEKLIPRPARSCEDPPLYLCLRMGRPINKKLQTYSPAIISFGKKKIEREYWFSVSKEKADNLYHFFHRWAPQIYGDVDDLNGCDERGLAPIDTDDENEDEETEEGTEPDNEDGKSDKSSEKTSRPKFWRRRKPLNFLKMVGGVGGHFTDGGVGQDWEVVPPGDSGRRFSELTELPLPELIGASDILTEELRKKLCKHLPARAVGYSWTLIYSSSKHGFSLKTLYREMNKYETPILLIIEDAFGTIFGALISCALRISEHFYGTGETFLFTLYPEFQCFPWTGENLFFVKGNPDSISIGAGDGNFGLWLDGDLYHGRSHPCKTFGNTMLSRQEDFVVKALECWGFV